MTQYLRIADAQDAEAIEAGGPFKAVVVIETAVSGELRDSVVERLRDAGCLYLMAWGRGCEDWADAALKTNGAAGGELIATRHPTEALTDVFRFARDIASHPDAELRDVRIVHLSAEDRGDEFLRRYEAD